MTGEIMGVGGRLRTNEGVVWVTLLRTPFEGVRLLTEASSDDSKTLSVCESGFEMCSGNIKVEGIGYRYVRLFVMSLVKFSSSYWLIARHPLLHLKICSFKKL